MLGEDVSDNSCFAFHLHFVGDGTPLGSFGFRKPSLKGLELEMGWNSQFPQRHVLQVIWCLVHQFGRMGSLLSLEESGVLFFDWF